MLNYDYSYTKEELAKFKREDRIGHIILIILIDIYGFSVFFALFLNSLIAWIILFIFIGCGIISMVIDLCKIIIGYFLHLPYFDCAHIRFFCYPEELQSSKSGFAELKDFFSTIFKRKSNNEVFEKYKEKINSQIDEEIANIGKQMEKIKNTLNLSKIMLGISGNSGLWDKLFCEYTEKLDELGKKAVDLEKRKVILNILPAFIKSTTPMYSGTSFIESFNSHYSETQTNTTFPEDVSIDDGLLKLDEDFL